MLINVTCIAEEFGDKQACEVDSECHKLKDGCSCCEGND